MFDSAETSGKKAPLSPPTPLLSVPRGSGRNMKSAPFLFPVYLLIITLEIRQRRAVPGTVPSGGCTARAGGESRGKLPGEPLHPKAAGLSPPGHRGGRGRHGRARTVLQAPIWASFVQGGESGLCSPGQGDAASVPSPGTTELGGVSRGVGSAKDRGKQR